MATPLCVSCGLDTDPEGRLIVAVSGSWGTAPLNFSCDDSNGEPVFCDSQGQLRTAPRATATRMFNDGVAFDGPRTLTATFDWYTPVTLSYTNTSSCRSMWVHAHARAEASYTMAAGSAYRLRAGRPISNTASGGGDALARDSQHATLGDRVVTVTGTVFGSLLLAPGATTVITTGMTTQCLSGTLTLHEHRYWMSAIGVTV
jgi:hypothetical protein